MQILLKNNELALTALKQASLHLAWLNCHEKGVYAETLLHCGFTQSGSTDDMLHDLHLTSKLACFSLPFFTIVFYHFNCHLNSLAPDVLFHNCKGFFSFYKHLKCEICWWKKQQHMNIFVVVVFFNLIAQTKFISTPTLFAISFLLSFLIMSKSPIK